MKKTVSPESEQQQLKWDSSTKPFQMKFYLEYQTVWYR